jgi:hypothetical protein
MISPAKTAVHLQEVPTAREPIRPGAANHKLTGLAAFGRHGPNPEARDGGRKGNGNPG